MCGHRGIITAPAASEDPASEVPASEVPAGAAGAGQIDLVSLFRARHVELVRLATLVVGDQATAEDVVQDVFARLWARGLLRDSDHPLAYVRAAVLNGCRSVLRRRGVAERTGRADRPAEDLRYRAKTTSRGRRPR